jgi:hypothetical protein
VSYSSEVLADSPIRYFKLDEQAGNSTAVDTAGGEDSTYFNVIQGVAAVVGAGIRTVAASSAYVAPRVASGLSTAWSLEFWYKYDSSSGAVIWRDNTTSTAGWLMQLANSNADLVVRANGTDRTITGAGSLLTATGWHHVVMTSSGTSVITYIDKVAVDTWTRTAAASTVVSTLRFGRDGSNATYYNAYYDEIAVYSTVLSAARVIVHYDTARGSTYTFGSYTVETFAFGPFTWTPPAGVTSYDALVVGGGGGGGVQANGGGAGGAGGLLWLTGQSCTPGVGISGSVGGVGAGGTASSTDPGDDGGNSVLGSNTATGGGGGGAGSSGTTANDGRAGGSGGGGSGSTSAVNQSIGGTGTSGQGSAGAAGKGSTTATNRAGGGGGGKGSAGTAAADTIGGNGGTGYDASADLGTGVGESGWFASGGGGGTQGAGSAVAGTASAGGGGAGGRSSSGAATSADNNTGGGGGGGALVAAGHGGSGFVAVRYLTSNNTANLTATDTITSTGVVGKVIGATLAATVAITAAGVVGKSSGAVISETATVSAAGDALAANEGSAALAATDTITATGVVGRSTGASLTPAATLTATGAVGTSSGAAAVSLTVTISAAGIATVGGLTAGASIAETATISAAGSVARIDTPTDTSNADDGIDLDGYATVIWEPDVVEPPFFVGPLLEDQVRTAARVIDTAPGALPNFTAATARVVYAPAARDRVLIDGVDFTYWNGAAVQVENMKLIDPLLYGGARITLPGINPQFPDEALGDLVERFRFARVKIQRVLDGEVVSTDSKGFVSRIDTSGTSLSLEVGGEAAGALSQMYVPPAVFRRKQDVEHICADLLRDARVQAKEHDGTSGVGLIKRGGSDGLTIFNETLAVWAGATGDPITWTPNADGVYRKTQKSATIVATAYIDSSLVSQSLAQDFMEQYTRVYARGFTANGEIVTNIKTPGLDQGDAPNFPLASGVIEVGMDDDDTTSGAGVTAAQQQLAIHNFLDFEDTTPGIFDALTERAVEAFQEVAGLNVTGEIGENTWDALWNLEAIGYSLDEAREYPMAQDPRTFKWYRTANGSKFRENPDYDPHFIPNDVAIDVGGPFGRGEIHDYADSKRAPDAGVWTGTLTFRSGLIWGNHSPGDPLVADDVMDRRDLLPNMRLSLPWFGGTEAGISVYVNGVDHGPEETQCLVSTVPATTMETWQAIERRREAKSNPGRSWSGHTRASQVRNDVAVQWDTRGGRIATKRALVEGWNEIQVPVGQAGIVQSIRAELQTPDEFAMLLTQKPVSVSALNNNPHTATPLTDPRPSARPWFEQESVVDWLEDRLYLDAWGTEKQPCGYDPSLKTDEFGPTAQPITGLSVETAGFNYETGAEPVLYLYIWVGSANNLMPGRILKNQRTTDF